MGLDDVKLLRGGEKGIRTLDTTLLSYAPLAGEYLQPLGHLSAAGAVVCNFNGLKSRAFCLIFNGFD